MELPRIDFTKLDQNKLIAHIKTGVDKARSDRSELESKWEVYTNMYLGVKKTKTFPWQGCSNLHVPLPQIVVETLVPRIKRAIFENDPICQVRGRGPEDDQLAELVQQFMDWAVVMDVRLEEMSEDWIRETLIYGTGIAKGSWVRSVDLGGQVKESFRFMPVALMDFYVPLLATSMEVPEFYCQQMRVSPDYIKKMQKMGDFRLDVEVTPTQTNLGDNQVQTALDRYQGVDTQSSLPQKQVRLYEWHGLYDANGDGYDEEVIITMAPDNNMLLKGVYNIMGRRPFYIARYIKQPHRFYGLGVIQQLEPLSKELDTIHNMRIDNGAIKTMAAYQYRKGSGHNPNIHKFYPGAGIPVEQIGDIQPIELGDVKASSFNEEEMIMALIQRATGVNDFSLGMAGKNAIANNQTATGITSVIAEGNIRFAHIIKGFQNAYKDIFSDILLYNQLFRDTEVFIKVLGSEGEMIPQSVNQDTINGSFDLIVEGNTTNQNPEVEFQRALQAYNLIIANPLIANNPVSLYHATRRFLKPLGLKEANKILPASMLNQMQAPSPIDQIRHAEEENDAMMTGQMVQILPTDDDQLHLRVHVEEYALVPEEFKSIADQHIADHHNQMLKKKEKDMGVQPAGAPGGLSAQTNTPMGG